MIGLLQAGGGYNADALSAACRISRRTIFRDLEILRQAGVPVAYDEERQRYSIPGSYYLPPTSFTAEEALAVLVLCRELGASGRLPFYGPAQSAAIKLESSLPGPLREHVREASDSVGIHLAPHNALIGDQPKYQLLHECAARRQAVRVLYDSFSDEGVIDTKLSPYHVFFGRRSWYVIARSAMHREVRTFNVGRFQKIEPIDQFFVRPRRFSVERLLRNAWHMIPEPGPDCQVVVRFKKKVARNVAEIGWHPTQRVVFHDDGTMDFHVTVSGLNEISWWIMGYGDQAEVIEPPELCQMIAERARRVVDAYEERLVNKQWADSSPGKSKPADRGEATK